MVNSGKKLLVLDINGLLLDTYYQGEARPDGPHDAKVNRFYVYKRAFCEEFIQFSLQNFIVGVWSSAREHNVLSLVDFMFKEAKEKLAFIWHQQHCTDTGFRHPDNKYKPVFLKELSKLWENFEDDLPWAKGDYGPSNTLLIDDSPYKAISNPRHTAIFPKTYKATDPDDNFLAGDLLPYLEGLLKARDVQKYIQRNPIGESSISPSDPQWSQIMKSDQFKSEEKPAIPAHLMAMVRPNSIVSSNQWMRPINLLPPNKFVGAGYETWNAGHGDRRSKRSDLVYRVPQLDGDYHTGTYDAQGYLSDFYERGAGPFWPSRHMSRDTSHDLIRKHAMLSERPTDSWDISRGPDRSYSDFHNRKRSDNRSSFRDYGSRALGWSEEPEDFGRGESWDFHRGGASDQEGSCQGEGKRKRRVDWTRDPGAVPMDEHRVIRTGERSRDREFEEPYSFRRRSSPRHDYRMEESQFRSKPRECRDFQRYAEKERPLERDLSDDSGRHSQKYDQSYDGIQHRSRRTSGRKI